jgi:hypothetical protein
MAVVGFGIGCQFRFGAQKKFIVDLFAGVGGKSTFYKRRSLDLQNVSIPNNFDNGFASRGNVSIGYIIH